MAEGSHATGNYNRKANKKRQKVVRSDENASDSLVSFKLALCALAILCAVYAGLFWVAHRSIYGMHVTPLPLNASLDKFSEGRTMKHIWHLADEIGIRQEGSIGLIQAADYLKVELESYKKKASPRLRVDIDETFVYGSFNMIFLKHSIALAYKNHSNIAIRISAAVADEDAPAVLVNGHFDSAIGSPGAGDCASCVASMLEAVRLIIDTDWVPPSPIIFLFNGAEELFMVACHGFMTTHKWRSTVGALINIEAAGAGGPDLVCQSGPGSWPAEVYTKAAVYPMANTAAQDIFPYMPGDTDYRMFSEDYGDIPGLDIILLLEGYVYHTPFDRPERMVPGSMQIRGENLMSLLRAFTSSSSLMNSRDRAEVKNKTTAGMEKRPVFFDYLGWFMISYPYKTAVALHTLPLGFVLFIASLTSYQSSGVHHFSQRVALILKGLLLHFIQMALAILAPVLLAIFRLLPASAAMTWFAQPWLAILMFVPISVAGMLLPKATQVEKFIMKKNNSNETDNKKVLDWGTHWGAIAMYSFGSALGTHFVVGNGFLSFWWVCFIIASYYILQVVQKIFGQRSLWSFSFYIVSLAFPILLSLYFGGMFWQTLEEKMGMNGSVPQPLGFYVADIIMAATTGYAVVLCLGPLMPTIGCWLASPHIVRFLIYLSVCAAAVSSQFFPYSPSAPKRVLLQHTINTDGNQILNAHYDLAVFDANSVSFVFNHVQAVPEFLGVAPNFSSKRAQRSPSGTWMALYPISHLFVESFRFSAESKDVLKNHPSLPCIILRHVEHSNSSQQRMHVELDLGSVHEVWAAVLNVTGPLINWSFSDQQLPVPEIANGGPPSYICRLSGRDTSENWKFWLEANESMALRVDVAVLDQQLEEGTKAFLQLFPSWAAVIAGSTYLSSYVL